MMKRAETFLEQGTLHCNAALSTEVSPAPVRATESMNSIDGTQPRTCQRAARAAFKNQHEHIFESAAARLPICAEKAKNEIQRRQQGAGQHGIVVGQRIQPAEERQQSASGDDRFIASSMPSRIRGKSRDDFHKVIKPRVGLDGERRQRYRARCPSSASRSSLTIRSQNSKPRSSAQTACLSTAITLMPNGMSALGRSAPAARQTRSPAYKTRNCRTAGAPRQRR